MRTVICLYLTWQRIEIALVAQLVPGLIVEFEHRQRLGLCRWLLFQPVRHRCWLAARLLLRDPDLCDRATSLHPGSQAAVVRLRADVHRLAGRDVRQCSQ